MANGSQRCTLATMDQEATSSEGRCTRQARLFEMPLRHLVLQGLPWPVCTPHKFHNFCSSKERPGSCEHHQDQPTKGSTICEPAKDDSGTPENNNQEGDTQANNSEDEG